MARLERYGSTSSTGPNGTYLYTAYPLLPASYVHVNKLCTCKHFYNDQLSGYYLDTGVSGGGGGGGVTGICTGES